MDAFDNPGQASPARPGRPPLWARLMEKLLAPWITIKREPEVPPFSFDSP